MAQGVGTRARARKHASKWNASNDVLQRRTQQRSPPPSPLTLARTFQHKYMHKLAFCPSCARGQACMPAYTTACTHPHAPSRTSTSTHIHTHMHTYTHTHTHTHMHMLMHTENLVDWTCESRAMQASTASSDTALVSSPHERTTESSVARGCCSTSSYFTDLAQVGADLRDEHGGEGGKRWGEDSEMEDSTLRSLEPVVPNTLTRQ